MKRIEINDTQNIRTLIRTDKIWFAIVDICKIVGNNTANLRKIIPEENIISVRVEDDDLQGRQRLTYFTDKNGLKIILDKSHSENLPLLKSKLKEYLDIERVCHTIFTGDKPLRFINIEGNPWFVGADLVKIIGNPRMFEPMPPQCLRTESIPDVKRPVKMVNIEGIKGILQKSRSLNVPLVLDGLSHFLKEEPVKVVYACKETSWLRIIKEAFAFLDSELQYRIGTYRIDLYFPELLLAVECDENGHSDRSSLKERTRQEYIEENLKCQFVRFNPDVENFNIGTVIRRIIDIFLTRQKVPITVKPPPKRKLQRKAEILPEKPCNVCKITKALEEFHKAQEHRDGRENVCKECRAKWQAEVCEEKRKTLPENYIEKECGTCKETLPLSSFYKDRQKFDGLAVKCKACWRLRTIELTKKPKKIITEKQCTHCTVTKKVEEFYKNKASPDGYAIYCSECSKKKVKDSYHKKTLEKRIAEKKAWRESKKTSSADD